MCGHLADTPAQVQTSLTAWEFTDINQSVSIWIPSPEIARQALVHFLEIWVGDPTKTEGIQREWGNISRHVTELGIFQPTRLSEACRYSSLVPFLVLRVQPHQRVLLEE
jgi:hypothetical protein